MVSEEGAFDEGADAGAFVGVELVERGEVQAQGLVLGAAFVFVEEELVGADGQSDRDPFEGVEAGLGLARFVAAQQGDVNVGSVGERLLGELLLLAEFG